MYRVQIILLLNNSYRVPEKFVARKTRLDSKSGGAGLISWFLGGLRQEEHKLKAYLGRVD